MRQLQASKVDQMFCNTRYTLPGANVELYLYRVSSDINSSAVLAARPTQR